MQIIEPFDELNLGTRLIFEDIENRDVLTPTLFRRSNAIRSQVPRRIEAATAAEFRDTEVESAAEIVALIFPAPVCVAVFRMCWRYSSTNQSTGTISL